MFRTDSFGGREEHLCILQGLLPVSGDLSSAVPSVFQQPESFRGTPAVPPQETLSSNFPLGGDQTGSLSHVDHPLLSCFQTR